MLKSDPSAELSLPCISFSHLDAGIAHSYIQWYTWHLPTREAGEGQTVLCENRVSQPTCGLTDGRGELLDRISDTFGFGW